MKNVTDLPAAAVKTEILIAWLQEAADGGVNHTAMRRLCWLAAEKLKLMLELADHVDKLSDLAAREIERANEAIEKLANIEKGSGAGSASNEEKPVTDVLGGAGLSGPQTDGPVIPTPTACPHCGHRHPPDGVCV